MRQARAGRLVDPGIRGLHPGWFTDEALPRTFGGEVQYDRDDLWFGSVLSSYGILFNRDSLKRLGVRARTGAVERPRPTPGSSGELGMCDPTKSGSIAAAYENVIQQQIHRRIDALRAAEPGGRPGPADGRRAVRLGWTDAMRMIQLVGANARYFTDTSQKPPIDVAAGDCAAGMCIDFYGREQQEDVRRRNPGPTGSATSRRTGERRTRSTRSRSCGAPRIPRSPARSSSTPSRWTARSYGTSGTGTPGGPRQFALRRLPVRRDFYAHGEWRQYRSDPDVNPYSQKELLVHHDEWTVQLFQEMSFSIRVMTEDTHPELVRAWRAIIAAPEPARTRALAVLQDVSAVDYDQAFGRIKEGLSSRNQVDAVSLARDLAEGFRTNYRRAERIARGGE